MVFGGRVQEAAAAFDARQYKRAYKLALPEANKGNPIAQMLLGAMYYSGRGVPKNYHQSANWYSKAYTAGHPGARNMLLSLCQPGGVLQKNKDDQQWCQSILPKQFKTRVNPHRWYSTFIDPVAWQAQWHNLVNTCLVGMRAIVKAVQTALSSNRS